MWEHLTRKKKKEKENLLLVQQERLTPGKEQHLPPH